MTTLTIKYNVAVLTAAGFRQEEVTATAEQISAKRCKVIAVTDVGGNGSEGYASRTGAKRQRYNAGYVASHQVGAVKNLSSVTVVD